MSLILPAEWAEQDAVMLTWPHAQSDWAYLIETIEQLYCELATKLSAYVPIIIAVPLGAKNRIEALLLLNAGAYPISCYEVASNDTWARDHGPITVFDCGRARLLDFKFNGWGGKFDASLDNCVSARLREQAAFGGSAFEGVDLVLEGGAIESDGAGTLLTTEACLLNPNRNPHLSRVDIELQLRQRLGVDTIHWLKHGYLAGDDTDSHIDTLARICPNNTIAYVCCDDPDDEHYPELAAMAAELAALRTSAGEAYRLVPLPWPKAVFDDDGQRLPATYANFLITNGAVFVPTYNDISDAEALAQLGVIFPEREIVGIDCTCLIQQHGSLHCITMQLPRGVLR